MPVPDTFIVARKAISRRDATVVYNGLRNLPPTSGALGALRLANAVDWFRNPNFEHSDEIKRLDGDVRRWRASFEVAFETAGVEWDSGDHRIIENLHADEPFNIYGTTVPAGLAAPLLADYHANNRQFVGRHLEAVGLPQRRIRNYTQDWYRDLGWFTEVVEGDHEDEGMEKLVWFARLQERVDQRTPGTTAVVIPDITVFDYVVPGDKVVALLADYHANNRDTISQHLTAVRLPERGAVGNQLMNPGIQWLRDQVGDRSQDRLMGHRKIVWFAELQRRYDEIVSPTPAVDSYTVFGYVVPAANAQALLEHIWQHPNGNTGDSFRHAGLEGDWMSVPDRAAWRAVDPNGGIVNGRFGNELERQMNLPGGGAKAAPAVGPLAVPMQDIVILGYRIPWDKAQALFDAYEARTGGSTINSVLGAAGLPSYQDGHLDTDKWGQLDRKPEDDRTRGDVRRLGSFLDLVRARMAQRPLPAVRLVDLKEQLRDEVIKMRNERHSNWCESGVSSALHRMDLPGMNEEPPDESAEMLAWIELVHTETRARRGDWFTREEGDEILNRLGIPLEVPAMLQPTPHDVTVSFTMKGVTALDGQAAINKVLESATFVDHTGQAVARDAVTAEVAAPTAN